MKICDSCGTVGGGHTPFCRYKNSDPTMLDVHTSHRVMPKGKECVNCKRSDVVGLTLECKVAQPVESFVIHPSHRLSPKAGQPVKCELCDASSRAELEKVCAEQENPIMTANEMRDRLQAKNVDTSPNRVVLEFDQNFVWMIYAYENSAWVPNVVSIHMTPQDAIKKHAELGGHQRIGKWPFGMELNEAVKKWEAEDE